MNMTPAGYPCLFVFKRCLKRAACLYVDQSVVSQVWVSVYFEVFLPPSGQSSLSTALNLYSYTSLLHTNVN